MVQPDGLKHQGCLVCKLLKAIYGLKQSGRAWYTNIDSFLHQHGLTRSELDYNLYFAISAHGLYTILILYVDDIQITGDDANAVSSLQSALENIYQMSNLGRMQVYVRLQFIYPAKGIVLLQTRYAEILLDMFGMAKCNPSTTSMDEGLQSHSRT